MAKNKEWMTWHDGETVKSVRLSEVTAIVQRKPPQASVVVVRGGVKLDIGHEEATTLKKAIGVK